MILIRKYSNMIIFKLKKINFVLFKGYTGPQIGPKWMEIDQNRGISDNLGPEDAIK